MYKSINCYTDKVIFLGNYCDECVEEVLMKQIGFYARKESLVNCFGTLLRKSTQMDPFAFMSTSNTIATCLEQIMATKKKNFRYL